MTLLLGLIIWLLVGMVAALWLGPYLAGRH